MAEYVDRYDVGSLESTQRRYSDLQLVRRLVGYMLRHRALLALELVLLMLKTATVLAGPYLYKVTLDFFIVNTPTSDGVWLADAIRSLAAALTGVSTPGTAHLLLSAALMYAVTALCEWAATSAQLYYVEKLGLLVIADIRMEFFDQINRLSQRFFEYGNTGRLVSRVTNDAEALKKVLNTGVIGLLADLLMAFSVLIVMAALDLQLTLIALLLAPVLALVSRIFQRWIGPQSGSEEPKGVRPGERAEYAESNKGGDCVGGLQQCGDRVEQCNVGGDLVLRGWQGDGLGPDLG